MLTILPNPQNHRLKGMQNEMALLEVHLKLLE